MEPTQLQPGDVVQIRGDHETFAGCFMLVTEPKAFGAQGFVSMPAARGELPGRAYLRPKWEDMEYVGRAVWVPADEIDEEAE
jgi:hypothetical protein